jgi:Protein of unknown function (DUF4232)
VNTTQRTAAATTGVLAVLVLAGCHSGPGSAVAASTTPAAAASLSVSAAASAEPVSPVTSAAPPGTGGTAAAPRCPTAGLSVTLGAPQGPAGGQQTMSLAFTNTSAAACTMTGYPGVNLVAGSVQWALARQSAAPEPVVLRPGGQAHSTLTILRWSAGDGTSFASARIYVTPPDETTFATVAWPRGVILVRQDEATRPGTFIGPVS